MKSKMAAREVKDLERRDYLTSLIENYDREFREITHKRAKSKHDIVLGDHVKAIEAMQHVTELSKRKEGAKDYITNQDYDIKKGPEDKKE
jgi:hypothetical protein